MSQPRDPAPSFGVPSFPQLLQNIAILTAGFPYTMTDDDCLVACNKAAPAAAIQVNLGTPWDGRIVGVKDYKGDAGTNNITVSGGGKNIEGAATDTIATDRAERWYRFDEAADEWKRIWSGAGAGGAPSAHATAHESTGGDPLYQLGQVTLVAGTVTKNAGITMKASSKVFLQMRTPGGVANGVQYKVTGLTPGAPGVGAFTVTAVDAAGALVNTDVSVLDYVILH